MKSSSTALVFLLALATITVGFFAWRQHSELRGLRVTVLGQDERAELQKRIWDLEKANRELSDEIAALRADFADAESPSLAAAGSEPTVETPPRDRPQRRGRGNDGQQQLAMRELMAKPEVQAVLDLQRKSGIEQRYAALFKNLSLSPDQAEKLKTLLAERQQTVQDIMLVGREQGINPRTDPEGFRKLITDAQNEINSNIKTVIGETGFTQLQTYEQTLPQRNLVGDLQQRLSYTDTPLSGAQAEQLIQILAATTPTPSRGGNAPRDPAITGLRGDVNALAGAVVNSGGAARGTTVPITSDAINQAQGVLSQPQVNALKELKRQQQAQQQLQQLIRSTMQQNVGARTPAPAPRVPGG